MRKGCDHVLEDSVPGRVRLENLLQRDKSFVADAVQHIEFAICISASKCFDGNLTMQRSFTSRDRHELVELEVVPFFVGLPRDTVLYLGAPLFPLNGQREAGRHMLFSDAGARYF